MNPSDKRLAPIRFNPAVPTTHRHHDCGSASLGRGAGVRDVDDKGVRCLCLVIQSSRRRLHRRPAHAKLCRCVIAAEDGVGADGAIGGRVDVGTRE